MQLSAARQHVWDVEPVFLRLGQLEIRYYGVLLALGLSSAFWLWYRRARAHGESKAFAEAWLWWSVPSELLGARIGEVLLYRWQDFVASPWSVLRPGAGMNSHGVSIALLLAAWGFSVRYKRPFLRIADYCVPGIAIAMCCVRLGNFFNSEIVGRPASVPWAIVFARFDAVPRHPVQLYELAAAALCVVAIMLAERRGRGAAGSGVSTGIFLTGYFSLRIVIEFFKEVGAEQLREAGGPFATLDRVTGLPLNTAQWLSLVPAGVGVVLLIRAGRRSPPVLLAPADVPRRVK